MKVENWLKDETISSLRVDLWDCKERPAKILAPYEPKGYVAHAWIPQTMGEQIWVVYQFKSVEDKVMWEESLPELIKKWIDPNVKKYAETYGWHIRNENGFY